MSEENRLNRIEGRQADGIGRISAIEKLAIAAEERAREDRLAAEERAREDRKAAEEHAKEDRRAAEERAREDRKAAEEHAKEDRRAAEERAKEDRKAAEERAKEDRQAAAAAQQAARQAAADARKEAATDQRYMMIIYLVLVVTVWGALAGAFFLGAKGLSSPVGSSPVQQVEVPARHPPAQDVMDGASDEIGDARPASIGLEHGSFLVRGSEKNRTRAIQAKHPLPAFSRRLWMQ